MMLAPRSFLFTRQPSPQQPSRSRPVKHDRQSKDRGASRSSAEQDRKDTSRPSNDSSPRPATPTSPLIIPMRGHHDKSHEPDRPQVRKERRPDPRKAERAERRIQTLHSPDAIPPSVAALLAITAIPPQRLNRGQGRSVRQRKLTVDAILEKTGVSEKELSISLGKSSLDFLLSPPGESEDDTFGSEPGRESVRSTRTMSSASIPSLDNESISDASPSTSSLVTPNSRGRRSLPSRRLQSLSSTPGDTTPEDHPLSTSAIDVDELDFTVFQRKADDDAEHLSVNIEAPRSKSAFKSNLTASLRALRSAARSFSALTTPLITPDDFLTRSIITIDPQVPFTDERMPPRLEDTPTPALRRYLNPTTNAPIEAHVPSSLSQTMSATKCTASIQMQTYKVSRSAKSTSPAVISRRTQPTSEDLFADVAAGPVARQRDMRENSDFIRIAVMEMEMRRRGKLDEQRPGRAKWILPPRKPATKPYRIGEDGVPVRWIAITV